MSYNKNISTTNPQPQQQQQKRRSSGSTLMLLASAVVLAGDASAFTQQLRPSVAVARTPRKSFVVLVAAATTTKLSTSATTTSLTATMALGGASVANRPVTKIDDRTHGNHYRQNKNHQDNKEYEEEDDEDDDEWEILIYDDQANTREKVARVLVQVTGRSETEAFRTMNQAHKTGVATVGTKLRFEVAEAYNEGLRTNGILSEIVPVMSSSSGSSNSNSSNSAGGRGSSEGHNGGEWQ
jgi:ATP-dependent Clp protease adapter protein ClpS